MPRYDFLCATCGETREVTVSYAEADDLTLVCRACGDDMTRAISSGFALHGGAHDDAAPTHAHPPGHKCGSCASATRLDRPNPFAADLPQAPSREES